MDFAFSEEQQMLRDSVRSWLADKFPPERIAELADSDEGWDRSTWREIAQLGWTGLSLPEEHGGSEMGFLDEAVVLEELGYGLYPGPYFSTVALALPFIARDAELATAVAQGEASVTLAWAEPSGPFSLADLESVGTKAEQANGNWVLTGEKHLIPDVSIVDNLVVIARAGEGLGAWLVKREDVDEARSLSTMDSTRRLGRLVLSRTAGRTLIEPGHLSELLPALANRAFAAAAVEAVGVAQRALDLATEYAKERKQFDKPIGVYQGVSHKIADTYVDTELARSLAYWAAWCVETKDAQAPVAATSAKSFAAEAAVASCERAIQVHGGVGFTWEHVLHRYYKRAQWLESFEGFGSSQRATVARSLLD